MQFYQKALLGFFFCFPFAVSYSQENLEATVDSLYREDQFYIGINYNLLANAPKDVSLRGFSGGLQLGYLRDMPINKRRNVAVAVGAGLTIDTYGQNLFIGEDPNEQSIFTVLQEDEVSFDRNRLSVYVAEIPLEFRWRTSTPESYKFWRIHAGFRVGYAFFYKSKFKQTGNEVNQTNIEEFDPLRLTATLAFGYNTFNFFASYSVNPFFDGAVTTEGEAVDLRTIKLGLIFYIL
jgi:hypothetical protein